MTEYQYNLYMKEIEALMQAKPNTIEGKRLDRLVNVCIGYEQKIWGNFE